MCGNNVNRISCGSKTQLRDIARNGRLENGNFWVAAYFPKACRTI